MDTALAVLRDRLSSVKPWAAVAVLMAVALVSFYAYQGWRYWKSTEELAVSTSKIKGLDAEIAVPVPPLDRLEEEREERERLLEEWAHLFGYDVYYDLPAIAALPAVGFGSPVSGVLTLNPSHVTDLQNGNLYVNLHTSAFPGGEILGRILPTGGAYTIHLEAGQVIDGIDFGDSDSYHASPVTTTLSMASTEGPQDEPDSGLGEIRGKKFWDLNGDGVDYGELGLQGWTIFLDANDNSVLDTAETSTVTDHLGLYSFSDLGPGSYVVREVLQPDWITVAHLGGTDAMPSSATTATGKGKFHLDEDSTKLFFEVEFSGVMSTTTGLYIRASTTPLYIYKGAPEESGPALPETDMLLSIVDEVAEATGITLNSMVVLGKEIEPYTQFQYHTQSLQLKLSGESHNDVYYFLSKLHQRLPNVRVYDFDLAGFQEGETPSADLVLRFYLAPEPVPQAGA